MPRPHQSSHVKPCQVSQILAHLEAHPEGITSLQAIRLFGCTRLAARAYEIERGGQPLVKTTVRVKGGKHVTNYALPSKRKNLGLRLTR